MKIGLIGDYDEAVAAHEAIPKAFQLASKELGIEIEYEWVPTEEIRNSSRISGYDGLWCVPASPYRSMEGALFAIQFAREHDVPFLGTCGGFQHAIIEYARNIQGWQNAEHAETAPDAELPVITQLTCTLVEVTNEVYFSPGTKIAFAYNGRKKAEASYRCRYGLNPAFIETLTSGQLRVGARDKSGEIRAVELDGHPFFVATLFQLERAALHGELPPLVIAFIQAITQRSPLKN